jgi:hypothetical protein
MTTTRKRPARTASSREKRVATGEIRRGVRQLEKSIGQIQRGLRAAERQIEADARARIHKLRTDARAQITALRGRNREVARILDKVSSAAEGSWQQVKRSADVVLAEGVNRAAAIVKRLKQALPR